MANRFIYPRKISFVSLALAGLVFSFTGSGVQAATPADQLMGYTAQAGTPAQPVKGQQLFTSRHGNEWSCYSCHTATPAVEGKHASTGKVIGPLAPAVNTERFFRVLGHVQPGSGLGWSIVKRVVDVSGATIEVGRSDRMGGLMVSVSWPAHQGESPHR